MPRVSDAYRTARREQIVAAALRVLRGRALRELTMADIIEESGLSAGSVYSHFAHKGELMEVVAEQVIGARLESLGTPDDGAPRSPADVVRWWLTGLEDAAVPFATLVQIWGEAASDPAMREIVQRRVADIEAAFTTSAAHWLAATDRDPADAVLLARAMLTVCQGYIVRSAVLGPQDVAVAVAAVSLA